MDQPALRASMIEVSMAPPLMPGRNSPGPAGAEPQSPAPPGFAHI